MQAQVDGAVVVEAGVVRVKVGQHVVEVQRKPGGVEDGDDDHQHCYGASTCPDVSESLVTGGLAKGAAQPEAVRDAPVGGRYDGHRKDVLTDERSQRQTALEGV